MICTRNVFINKKFIAIFFLWYNQTEFGQFFIGDKNKTKETKDIEIFVKITLILNVLRPIFEEIIVSRRVDVVWPPWSYDSTPLDYYFLGAVQDKFYADKSETVKRTVLLKALVKYSCAQSIMSLKIGSIV